MREDWNKCPFESCLEAVPKTKKIPTSSYLVVGSFPIVSQEDGKISGYWNEYQDVLHISHPVIVFGDHTRVLKYIDFDFVIGADGVKVLSPKSYLIPKFLYHYLCWCKIPSLGYSRHYKLLKELSVPVPAIEEQERIVAELDLLTGIIDKQKAQLKEFDTLAQSIFYDMFGDPLENEKGWEKKTIGDVCTLKSGNSSANNSSEGDLPYVKVGDMNIPENIPFITTSSTFVDREENRNNIMPIGTVIFPKRGGAIYTNKKRITSVEICCDLNTMGVIPSKSILSSYLYHYFLTLDFGDLCNGAAIPQLNNIDIAPLPIGMPPIELQKSFAERIQEIESQKASINRSIAETQKLFDYTMDKYFG